MCEGRGTVRLYWCKRSFDLIDVLYVKELKCTSVAKANKHGLKVIFENNEAKIMDSPIGVMPTY